MIPAHGDTSQPPLTPDRWLDNWEFEPVVVGGLILAAAFYGLGVARLHRRGVAWSPWRGTLWLFGLLIVFVATSSAVAVYDTTLFSMHAVQHMLLQMFAPVPLALAAPITLALRALPVTPRRLLVTILHSPVSQVLSHPLVAFALFVASPFALYYSSLYEATLRIDWLHNLNHLHFIAVGLLFYVSLLGLDPLPNRPLFVFRIFLIIGVGVSHILLGIPIMMGTDVFAEDFYLELGRTWGPSLVDDQQLGGAILWILGDFTVVAFLIGVLKQWGQSDAREAKRVDRQLDRVYGDAAYTPPWWETDQRTGSAQPPTRR